MSKKKEYRMINECRFQNGCLYSNIFVLISCFLKLVVRSSKFTLCPVYTVHLPQGRVCTESGFTAQSSMPIAHSYLKRNSTVNKHSKFPQRWACPSDSFRRDCIYNTSISVCSKAGSEGEELAFRACELLLN